MKTLLALALALCSMTAAAQYAPPPYAPVPPTTPTPPICHTIMLPGGQYQVVCS
jgi:hypothetical protein